MNVNLVSHPIVPGLFLAVSGDFEICFSHASFEPEESKLIFERDDEVVTAKVSIDCEQQLAVWENALGRIGVELERLVG